MDDRDRGIFTNLAPRISVFLAEHQKSHPEITDQAIADRLGLRQVSLISMMRQGAIKVPLAKLVDLAHVLGVDAVFLTRLRVQDDQHGNVARTNELIERFVSKNEFQLIQAYRGATGDRDITIPEALLSRIGDMIAGAVESARSSTR